MARSLIPFQTDLPRPFHRLRQEMDRLFDRFFLPDEIFEETPTLASPHMDLAETEKQFEITMEMPGMEAKDINIDICEGNLCISGEAKREEEKDGKTFHRVERHYGRFCRTLPLPSGVDKDNIAAEYKQGILKITVPKTDGAKPQRIEVKS